MMACCEFCYQQYIETDGKIDWTVLLPLQQESQKLNPVVLKEGEERRICRCQCHIKGIKILH